MRKAQTSPTLKLVVGDDDRLYAINGKQRWLLTVCGDQRTLGLKDIDRRQSEHENKSTRTLQLWRCDMCDRFVMRPDHTVAIVNHVTRVHGLDPEKDADAARIDEAKAQARELLKDPAWVEKLAAERKCTELVRKADAKMIEGLRASCNGDYDRARKLYRESHKLADEARAL